MDYDLWLGPAPERPFNPNRFHYNWHWNWDYGTGELGNNGIHGLDVIRWVVGLDAPTARHVRRRQALLRRRPADAGHADRHLRFPGTTVVWEHRIWSKTGMEGDAFGMRALRREGHAGFRQERLARPGRRRGVGQGGRRAKRPHKRNFLDRIKDGKRPNADIEEGHKSTRLCHLGNIAYRVGRALKFDAATETIEGDAEANGLLARTYRKGFVLPEKV